MDWHGVYAVEVVGVHVWVVFILFTVGVVCDVEKLIAEIVCVSYAMVVISGVPDFSGGLLPGCEGITALDVLDAFCGGCGLGASPGRLAAESGAFPARDEVVGG